MTTRMGIADGWIEWKDGARLRRTPLRGGLTLIGGKDADIPHAAAGNDQLQIWDDPPKVVFVGAGARPRVGSREGDELPLRVGDVILWRGAQFALGGGGLGARDPYAETHAGKAHPGEAQLEEIDLGAAPRTSPAAAVGLAPAPELQGFSKSDAVAWGRVKAGLLVELGIADPKTAHVWQQAIARREFDADACTREILRLSHFPESDPRLVERAGRLQRDLLMSPLQAGARGTTRRVRRAAKGGLAFVVAQFAAVLAYSVLLAIFFLLARMQWGWSVDGLLDRLLALVPGGG